MKCWCQGCVGSQGPSPFYHFKCGTCGEQTPWCREADDEYPDDCDSCATLKMEAQPMVDLAWKDAMDSDYPLHPEVKVYDRGSGEDWEDSEPGWRNIIRLGLRHLATFTFPTDEEGDVVNATEGWAHIYREFPRDSHYFVGIFDDKQ